MHKCSLASGTSWSWLSSQISHRSLHGLSANSGAAWPCSQFGVATLRHPRMRWEVKRLEDSDLPPVWFTSWHERLLGFCGHFWKSFRIWAERNWAEKSVDRSRNGSLLGEHTFPVQREATVKSRATQRCTNAGAFPSGTQHRPYSLPAYLSFHQRDLRAEEAVGHS